MQNYISELTFQRVFRGRFSTYSTADLPVIWHAWVKLHVHVYTFLILNEILARVPTASATCICLQKNINYLSDCFVLIFYREEDDSNTAARSTSHIVLHAGQSVTLTVFIHVLVYPMSIRS